MLSVIVLTVVMLSVIVRNDIMLSVLMPSVIMLSVIMLSVIILNVVAPKCVLNLGTVIRLIQMYQYAISIFQYDSESVAWI